jgi:hypothetical protein
MAMLAGRRRAAAVPHATIVIVLGNGPPGATMSEMAAGRSGCKALKREQPSEDARDQGAGQASAWPANFTMQ